jgi:hypothetical protein
VARQQRGDDDIELYADESRREVALTWHGLRQQTESRRRRRRLRPSRCLADFVPQASGVRDYIGAFACTAGIGAREKIAEFIAAHDDYSAITFKALADRLAEACAEWLHHRVRTDLWGFVPDERFSKEEMIDEKYQGIRPPPATPPAPTTASSSRCSRCWAPPTSACRSPKAWPCSPAPASAAFTSATRPAPTSTSAPSTTARPRTWRRAAGGCGGGQRALGPNLGL